MNINPIMFKLGEAVGLPIEQDDYEGKEDKFLTFTYADEEDAQYGDNHPEVEICYMQISLYTPRDFDYFKLKSKIKQFLRNNGFTGLTCKSWLEDPILKTQRRRHTVFECHTMKGIGKTKCILD